MEEPIMWSGIGPLTYKQACTLVKIIGWACKHEDCDVTVEDGMDLCKAIQYFSNTRSKEAVKDDIRREGRSRIQIPYD